MKETANNQSRFIYEIIEALVIAVVLAVIIRTFIFQPFYIPSGSMEPTLQPNDRIIVNKFIYSFKQPKRGDVIVFEYPVDPSRDFIKRVIGLPGDTIEIRNNKVYINDEMILEPYLPDYIRMADYGPTKIKEGHYFMMGDNRGNSEDSRFWGLLPEENILGKAITIYWPVNRMSIIKDLSDFTPEPK